MMRIRTQAQSGDDVVQRAADVKQKILHQLSKRCVCLTTDELGSGLESLDLLLGSLHRGGYMLDIGAELLRSGLVLGCGAVGGEAEGSGVYGYVSWPDKIDDGCVRIY